MSPDIRRLEDGEPVCTDYGMPVAAMRRNWAAGYVVASNDDWVSMERVAVLNFGFDSMMDCNASSLPAIAEDLPTRLLVREAEPLSKEAEVFSSLCLISAGYLKMVVSMTAVGRNGMQEGK